MTNTPNNIFPRINEVISKNQTGAIVLPTNLTADSVAAATALYLALNQLNKTISLVAANKADFDLIGVDKIQSKMATGGENLVISLPYVEGSIDKVDYQIEGENFNLVITPRAGFAKFTPEQVKYTYTGGTVNFIIVLDSPTLNNLGTSYTENKTQYQGRDIINIDRHLTNASFGTINFVDKTSSSVSELILDLIQNLNVEIDKDIATNLYAGIASATNNFTSYSVNAKTFENAAFLLKHGALKKLLKKPMPTGTGIGMGMGSQFGFPRVQPSVRPIPARPKGPVLSSNEQHIRPIEEVEKLADNDDDNTPNDWLKPKIFRGGGLME